MTAAADANSEQRPMRGTFINKAGFSNLITVTVLALACLVGFMCRLFAIIRFESIIHEFDPWFNYRSTVYLVQHGYHNFRNWFDERAWYPLGRVVGGTVYPGLMFTSGTIHWILHTLNITIHIREICVFLAPIFSGLTAIATYLLTSELWSRGAGLFAACFIAIVPGYTARSVGGSYDNEAIAIFALQFTYWLWIKSMKSGSIFWSVCAALSYFYMVLSWGGYVFIINLIPLHVFTLLVMGRFSFRLYVSYCVFYIVGLLLSMQVPFVGFLPIRTSEHMAALGVFGLMQTVGGLRYLSALSRQKGLRQKIVLGGLLVAILGFLVVVALTYAGVIAPWTGRFYSLWDTNYAKVHIPIIASVSEHQPTTWISFFYNLHVLVCTFPVGVWYCVKQINDERVFVVLYAVSAVYFAGVMSRLLLTVTPVVCVLAGVAFSIVFDVVFRKEVLAANVDVLQKTRSRKAGKNKKGPVEVTSTTAADERLGIKVRLGMFIITTYLTIMFCLHSVWITSEYYSNPSIMSVGYTEGSIPIIFDDRREAYGWLAANTADDARVMSWWDYGYQITGLGNRTTIVDNNTWNNSHIALVGKAMASNESAAYSIMTKLDVDYVLVMFGGATGSDDDLNIFLWMVRIAAGEHPDIHEEDYYSKKGEYRIDSEGSETMLNSLMYKLCFYRWHWHGVMGYDHARNVVPGNLGFSLTYLEEAYTSQYWRVRIYRVKKPDEFNRRQPTLRDFERKKRPVRERSDSRA